MRQGALYIETNRMIETIGTVIKTKSIYLLSLIATFFTPVIPFIITTFFFIILDTVMGFLKIKYIGETRNSNGFKRGFIPKVIIYSLVLIVVYTADKIILTEAVAHYTSINLAVTKIIALILIFIETWSIDENFKAIFKVSLVDKFKQLITYSKKNLRKLLDNDSK
jgi:hypothetical protein